MRHPAAGVFFFPQTWNWGMTTGMTTPWRAAPKRNGALRGPALFFPRRLKGPAGVRLSVGQHDDQRDLPGVLRGEWYMCAYIYIYIYIYIYAHIDI